MSKSTPAPPLTVVPPAPPQRRPDDRLPLALMLSVPAAVTLVGLPYYLLGQAARIRSPYHAWLKPSGPVGLALGVAGFALFVFMWLYPLRKKFRWLAFTGAIAPWLRVHTLAGLVLPFLVAVHAGWHFDGLIGLGYFSMLLVAMSGVVGRYLYVHIPRSRTGLELTIEQVATERRALITHIATATRLDPMAVERSLAIDAHSYAKLGPARTVVRMIADDVARWRAVEALRREWSRPQAGGPALDRRSLDETLQLARQELALSQQVRMLDATRQLFGLWHVVHRPFAITALLAVLVHVAVALAVGAVRIS